MHPTLTGSAKGKTKLQATVAAPEGRRSSHSSAGPSTAPALKQRVTVVAATPAEVAGQFRALRDMEGKKSAIDAEFTTTLHELDATFTRYTMKARGKAKSCNFALESQTDKIRAWIHQADTHHLKTMVSTWDASASNEQHFIRDYMVSHLKYRDTMAKVAAGTELLADFIPLLRLDADVDMMSHEQLQQLDRQLAELAPATQGLRWEHEGKDQKLLLCQVLAEQPIQKLHAMLAAWPATKAAIDTMQQPLRGAITDALRVVMARNPQKSQALVIVNQALAKFNSWLGQGRPLSARATHPEAVLINRLDDLNRIMRTHWGKLEKSDYLANPPLAGQKGDFAHWSGWSKDNKTSQLDTLTAELKKLSLADLEYVIDNWTYERKPMDEARNPVRRLVCDIAAEKKMNQVGDAHSAVQAHLRLADINAPAQLTLQNLLALCRHHAVEGVTAEQLAMQAIGTIMREAVFTRPKDVVHYTALFAAMSVGELKAHYVPRADNDDFTYARNAIKGNIAQRANELDQPETQQEYQEFMTHFDNVAPRRGR
ncbi:hypothetical protein [Duganella qianjiadongensis]|uniref:Type III effector protein n=1 Tax=Duganella qianjiadongensis TaxID=2692176 RepID=A0ABW9VH02_9BURK|nr:hypothetical protein [Duganella qianjiadongensis]MYM37945.1 hypothetical protein [Duganella qianjiadongensis]